MRLALRGNSCIHMRKTRGCMLRNYIPNIPLPLRGSVLATTPKSMQAPSVIALRCEFDCSYGQCKCFSISQYVNMSSWHKSGSWSDRAHRSMSSILCHYEITSGAYNEYPLIALRSQWQSSCATWLHTWPRKRSSDWIHNYLRHVILNVISMTWLVLLSPKH